ncbi:MAG: DUF763 domain-containing protein [Candidatus Liptonbacteria bacterium]|nr:DUF763 domain-containing protein [Candidatus Liptonbacteria bacterium]
MRRGVATFTLDNGRCPKWLFERMVKLGREMTDILVAELGPDEFIKRIADPVWFQSLGTVLAFDWNASGLTTILTAALKESIRGREKELGIFICGGKGKTSRKTPEEIKNWGSRLSLSGGVVSNLTYNSRMAAKVDSALIQDGFQIYHHSFFFSRSGSWAVVQQGMNQDAGTARRYHWFSQNVKDLVCEPHTGITSEIEIPSLNMVAKNSENSRAMSLELSNSTYTSLMKDIQILRRHVSRLSQTLTVGNQQGDLFTVLNLANREFHHHPVEREEFSRSKYLEKILSKVTSEKPESYEKFLAMEGVGPKTVRALALVGEVIYGAKPSYEDPARYSFAFGGKDATPYPVDRPTYDKAISLMHKAANNELSMTVKKSKIGFLEKEKIVRRLENRNA